ncbi:MAG: EAL domain-containing protein [Oscillospiraceae bacterium]|nr:EAL domain-containing protein [Oscillospiraceae bacterium]
MAEQTVTLLGSVENYSQVGDIIVIAMSILFLILFKSSFVNRTRGFFFYCLMLLTMVIAAYSNVIIHVLSKRDIPQTVTLILRVLHYSALFGNLYLFMLYFVEMMRLDKRRKIRYLVFGAAVLAVLILYLVIGALRDVENEGGSAGMRVFTIGYLAFIAILAYMSFRHRGRIYKQITTGVLASACIAIILLLIQGLHRQSSYTVVSFLFPAVALLYLVHANPYDIDIGAVNVSGFEEFLSFHREHGNELLLMSLRLPELDKIEGKYPTDLQWTIRHFATHFFRNAVLFQITNGRMILAMETGKNADYEDTLRNILGRFDEAYEKYHLDHKIVILTTLFPKEKDEGFNYIDFVEYLETNMPVNSIHRVTHGDVDDYTGYRYIINELGDISAKQNMDDERVLVYCQPVYNLSTGRYDTAEALMRLQLDKIGIVPPGRFIPLAEEHNYISALSMTILSKTCAQVRGLLDEGYEVRRISVNFSMLDLRDPNFGRRVSEMIRRSGIPSEKIAIELTESQNERDFMLVKERISELHDSGVKFYLDDFGTGYSNFERIMQLPFDIIKFDRSLVIASGTDADKQTMVSNLAHMFKDMHYSVLYEGIETESDQERCENMCAEYLQGYKFSAPIPIEKLREYFAKSAAV